MPSLFRRSLIGLVLGLALCAALVHTARAQPALAEPVEQPREEQGSAGVRALTGGAGSEDRKAMDARHGEFPLKLVLTAGRGEFIVAESLELTTPQGTVLSLTDAGPVVLIQAPAGAYTFVAKYQGRTQRIPARIGKGKASLQLRFPG